MKLYVSFWVPGEKFNLNLNKNLFRVTQVKTWLIHYNIDNYVVLFIKAVTIIECGTKVSL